MRGFLPQLGLRAERSHLSSSTQTVPRKVPCVLPLLRLSLVGRHFCLGEPWITFCLMYVVLGGGFMIDDCTSLYILVRFFYATLAFLVVVA